MGLGLTLLTTGLGVGSIASSSQNARKQAKAIKAEATLKANQRAKETTALAARQRVSFLNSGISLTGEYGSTPRSIESDTYAKGREDIEQIEENYNTKLDNLWSRQRSAFLSQLGSLALGLGGSTANSLLGTSTSVATTEGFGIKNAMGESGSFYKKLFDTGSYGGLDLSGGISLGG